MSNKLVTIKLKDKNWGFGHLRGNFTVSTYLATQIIALIAANKHHDYTPKVTLRDEKGRFASTPDGELRAEQGELQYSLKKATTSLIKELVAEAKPENPYPEGTNSRAWEQNRIGFNEAIDQFEQNLLKALNKEK